MGPTAPVVSALDIDTPVAVRLGTGDPTQGWIRTDEVNQTYVPWLTELVGTTTTHETLAARTTHRNGSLTIPVSHPTRPELAELGPSRTTRQDQHRCSDLETRFA